MIPFRLSPSSETKILKNSSKQKWEHRKCSLPSSQIESRIKDKNKNNRLNSKKELKAPVKSMSPSS